MSKHTPAPWVITSDRCIYGSGGIIKPFIASIEDDHNDSETDANALLISAAPDLLACLLDVLDADGDLYAMDFDRYRAAIKKATEEI